MVRKFKSSADRVLASAKIKPDYPIRQKKLHQFKDRDNKNMTWFWWKKSIITQQHWLDLDKATKAIWPVIACHASEPIKGETRKVYPSQSTIAILAGYSIKSVRYAIPELTSIPEINLEIKKERGKNDLYSFDLPIKEEGKQLPAFRFHKEIIVSGVWRELSPSAKALYPVMRCFAHFNKEDDLEDYADSEGIELDYDNPAGSYSEVFEKRRYDFCTEKITNLCHFAGITAPSYKTAIKHLTRWGLIENFGYGRNSWKVYFTPQRKGPKPEELNKKTKQSFQYLLDKEQKSDFPPEKSQKGCKKTTSKM